MASSASSAGSTVASSPKAKPRRLHHPTPAVSVPVVTAPVVVVLVAAAVVVLAEAPVVPAVVVTVAAIAALLQLQPLLLRPESALSFPLIPNYLSSLWQCSLKE